MQLISCHLAVAGDDHSIVVREHDTAVTYPEMLILKALHGGDAVRNVADAGDVERDPDEERRRLQSIYGAPIVAQVFPGEHTPLPEVDRRMRGKAKVEAEEEDPFTAPDKPVIPQRKR